jgi:hypothetical protein
VRTLNFTERGNYLKLKGQRRYALSAMSFSLHMYDIFSHEPLDSIFL